MNKDFIELNLAGGEKVYLRKAAITHIHVAKDCDYNSVVFIGDDWSRVRESAQEVMDKLSEVER